MLRPRVPVFNKEVFDRARGSGELDGIAEDRSRTIEAMRDELGEHGFQWLCACAVYPGLRWPLTLALGQATAAVMNRPVPDEEEILAISRLPWFRRDSMPEEMRPALLRELNVSCAEATRKTVASYLLSMTQAASQEDAEEAFAQPPSSGWRSVLEKLWRREPNHAALRDTICMEFMLGAPASPALQGLDQAMSRITGQPVWSAASMRRNGTIIVAAIVASAALWFALARFMPPAESEIRTVRLDFEPGRVFSECPECPGMVMIPAGAFMMGSPEEEEGRYTDEGSQREVRIQAFALAATEVTFDQWMACAKDGGCQENPVPDDEGWGRDTRPVINVSWNDAQDYIRWLNSRIAGDEPYRLPTEAEWEYAARATNIWVDGNTQEFVQLDPVEISETRYFWGDFPGFDWMNRGTDECCGGAAQSGDRWMNTAPVSQFPKNGFGLSDMHGNVWEWVQDCWHDTYEGAPTDGSAWLSEQNGDCSLRMLRGGSWSNSPQVLRSASRFRVGPDFRGGGSGFRPARTLLTP